MEEFIHRENLALFRRRLADPTLTEAHRKVLLLLLAEEQAKQCHRSNSLNRALAPTHTDRITESHQCNRFLVGGPAISAGASSVNGEFAALGVSPCCLTQLKARWRPAT